jgi:hypothetical protein
MRVARLQFDEGRSKPIQHRGGTAASGASALDDRRNADDAGERDAPVGVANVDRCHQWPEGVGP